ncbi:alpha/beta hydrolase [Actinoplanes sp. NEAU-A12]|uniref:Alpha/beta hydrolase n=1 Tax=Actinoplanes sandaracinus TaxID=3045177 RepID=A0ABT6WPM1_9ACTN|nr:alpha/beta hydrolase [Actinoplanes sandaracinus]MDI6101662.1 alpha/beta hydrolase [Actinoplanes sandaracinus]
MITTTDRPASAAARLPGRRPRLRRLGRGLIWAFDALIVVLGLAFFAPRAPVDPVQDLLGMIALFVPWLTGFLIAVVVIGAGTTLLLLRRGHRALSAAGALTVLLAGLMVIVPWSAARGSWVEHFTPALSVAPTATETYAPGLQVDVYLPPKPAPSRPALLYVHGGGWSSGARADSASWFGWMADQGITVYSVDYRLAPPPRWQDAVGDVKCALGWVRSAAARHGVTASNVSIAGDSAGGQLAMMAAYTVGDERFPPACDVPEEPVRSVMGWYAPTDLPALLAESGLPGAAAQAVGGYLGDQDPAVASPITYARPGLPPTLLVQGDRDHMIPTAQATALVDRLRTAGVSAEVVTIPWAEHNFTGHWGSWGSQAMRPVVGDFLRRHVLA